MIEDYSLVNFTALDIQAWEHSRRFFLILLVQTPSFSKSTVFHCCLNTAELAFQGRESVGDLVKVIDESRGYIFAGVETSAVEFSKTAVGPRRDYYRYSSTIEFSITSAS